MNDFKTLVIILLLIITILQQFTIEKSEELVVNYSNRYDEAMQTIYNLQPKE